MDKDILTFLSYFFNLGDTITSEDDLCNTVVIYLENINLTLAFIIYIISQPIEHLNIYSVFIVCSNTEMHVILYGIVNVYSAIMIN